jgi:RNA polymerase sigma-19 factor, ECF subfamily
MMALIDESLLLQQMADGSQDAFSMLFRHYQPKVYYYLLPFTEDSGHPPEEIIQDIFLRIWSKRASFVGIQSFEYYLYRMARNRLMDIYRSEKSRQKNESVYNQVFDSQNNRTENEVEFREYHDIALKAINELPERRRQIFELSTQQDLSLDEIAARLDLSKDVVKKQLYLANRSIRDYIRRHGDMLISFLLLWMQKK